MQQYWVGDFYVDVSRNQITKREQAQTIAPKALSVLTYLAENQGRVVSQDELLDAVWQGTIVSPNTLQRSIAQLRKVLGDDGKEQVYIKTHAKKGYSLECDVQWSEGQTSVNVVKNNPPENNLTHTQNYDAKASKFSPVGVLCALLVFAMIVVGYQYWANSQTPTLTVSQIRALTATDNKESAGIYSHDGQFIIFHRFSEQACINNIWAKNIKTQQEYQLTKDLGVYSSHSLSQDGSKLTFVSQGDCEEQIVQKKCYKLVSLDFNKALESPLTPTVLMQCKASEIRNPSWLSNDNIALMQKSTDSWKIINYSVSTNSSEVIYEIENGSVIDYDFSMSKGVIALMSVHQDGQYYIEMLKPNGEVLSSNRVQYPEQISKFRYIYPNFSSLEQQLIFSTGKRLFTINTDGLVRSVSLPLDQPIGSPRVHPDGGKMLAIKGYYDSDIVSLPIAGYADLSLDREAIKNHVLQRSNVSEDSAKFQPDGEHIAFTSERSGELQVWISDGQSTWQLSQFPIDTNIFSIEWAQDGQSILVNADKELVQLFLDGTQRKFALSHSVDKLFQWDSTNNIALSLIWSKGAYRVAKLDLETPTNSIVYDKSAVWAQTSATGALIYTDLLGRFWQPGPAEDQIISALNGQGSDKRFVVHGDTIFGVNDDLQLWSYTLDNNEYKVLGNAPSNLDFLTDTNGSELLMSVQIASRKEVIELTFE
ncbi:winged helix-turn-helix domain-containing protein [Pseudoalteromonas sp. S16_S37]|uniref:winged helix-turn-helix domain-containing protein n=1 Tax=Pseudoalteromonas sp. S16_S37 TaxID=2720228 RepID=UPI00168008E1|nr:transcriptional regulator [Pseudoalteromonas sp. S16_S37]